jgi:hypothetical protein
VWHCHQQSLRRHLLALYTFFLAFKVRHSACKAHMRLQAEVVHGAMLVVTALSALARSSSISVHTTPAELPTTKAWVANTWNGAPGGPTGQSQWVPIAMDGFFVKE